VINIFSIDLEDWNQLAHRRVSGETPPASANVLRQMDVLLPLLAQHKVKATFFVLGMLAERHPELVRRVAAEGHEIASHGYGHKIVYRLSRAEFAEDTRRAKGLLEEVVGQPVRGYRAAEFSIRQGSLWALEVLAELGFEYDSSIFPIRHRRYGIPGFSPEPARYELKSGRTIVELPLSTLRRAGVTLPVAGGGYFRLMPEGMVPRVVAGLNARGRPLITYFHPYEFDPQRLDVFATLRPRGVWQRVRAAQMNFHQNLGRRTITSKIAGLIKDFEFTTCRDYLHATELRSSRALL
jgi:polysaccharide deacetylase family protein (PEP-CTERM system associated)